MTTIDNVGSGVISPDGRRIAQMIANAIWIWDLDDNSYSVQQNLRDENGNPLSPFGFVRWSDANTIYYGAFPFGASSLNQQEIWRYDLDTTSNTKIIEPDTTNYRVPIPLYFDVRSNNLLYWMRNFAYSEYSLNYLGNWSYTSPDFTYYGVYWSPRAGENRAIRVKTNPNNSSEYCIDTFQTVSLPTNFNRITCQPMQFGFVNWATDVNLEATIQVPPTEACLAQVQGRYGFRMTPSSSATGVFTDAFLNSGTNIIIKGTNGTWYYAEYNGRNGWIIAYGAVITDVGCTPPLASYNLVTGEVDYPNIVYDYELEFPEPPWYTTNNWSTLSMEEKFSIWRTEGAIYLWDGGYPNLYSDTDDDGILNYRDPDYDNDGDGIPNRVDDDDDNDGLPDEEELYTCTGDSDATSKQNCTLLNFVVFYELFYRIYGPERPLMVSDILAVTYPLELTSASVFNADMAKQALGTYYFYQVRDYCNKRPDTCDEETLQMPIEHFVYRYTYINNNGIEVVSDGFLPPLNAWYHRAILIANWYFGTPAVDISLIRSWEISMSDLSYWRLKGAERLTQLLKPTAIDENLEVITMARLTLSLPRPTFSNLISPDGPITWANFPYPGPLDTNGDTDFWRAVMAPMPPQIESNVKICVLNQSFDDKGTPNVEADDTWALDAFAIVIDDGNPGFGTTPPWADTNYSRSFGAYLSCLCSQTKVTNGC